MNGLAEHPIPLSKRAKKEKKLYSGKKITNK